MPDDSTIHSVEGRSWRDFWIVLACLAAVLSVLFYRSFEPGIVVFSNDGPLGAAQAQAASAWANFTGYWQDLNWLGGRAVGGFLTFGNLFFALLGPVLFCKFIAPVSLLLLGLSAWFCFRQFGFHPIVCILGGLAAALNMNAFSVNCWGLSGWTLSRAGFFLAIAALPGRPVAHPWLRTVLAGVAIGMGLMDGFDVGALYSLYAAAFVLFQSLTLDKTKSLSKRASSGLVKVAMVAVCAALVSAQGLTTLIGTQVKGVVGMAQDTKTREQRWNEATQWSLPRIETLRLFIPGLFGYRMPELYGEPEDATGGENYWGAIGRTPDLERIGQGMWRHAGNGEFAGVLVTLLAVWATLQAFRRKGSVFTEPERRLVWFWSGAALISLLLAFGRHAPFYQLFYAIPYFSTIRNPVKFTHPLHVSLIILFAFALQGLWRRYVTADGKASTSIKNLLSAWWKSVRGFDRNWTVFCALVLVASSFAWLLYSAAGNSLANHLRTVGFPDEKLAHAIAGVSVREAGLFVLFFGLSAFVVVLLLSGAFARPRAKWAGLTVGALLVIDLVRADLPWIVYQDYKYIYATNPIIDFLRMAPHEKRVTAELVPLTRAWLLDKQTEYFGALYYQEWLQHHFQFYRIQSLDIIQMPRVPEFDLAFMKAFRPVGMRKPGPLTLDDLLGPTDGRLWQLTSTRYVIGHRGFLDVLNQRVDPGKGRFRVHTPFNAVPRPGVDAVTKVEQLTAVVDTNGQFALFEFTGALPRAKLFTQWQVSTNDEVTLQRLSGADFDPEKLVLVAEEGVPAPSAPAGTNSPAGTVAFTWYAPKVIRLEAEASAPSILLLNDHHDPGWKVLVDGKPERLLRCNYIMRGVQIPAGKHSVEFRFQPPATAFYVSLTSLIAGLGLCGFLTMSRRASPPRDATASSSATDQQRAAGRQTK